MYGPDSGRGPTGAFEWWFSAIFLLLIAALFGALIVVDYDPVKLVPVFFVVSWLVLLPIHEAGHALVAHLVGWRVGQVVIGMGRVWQRFLLGKTVVELRMFPIEGFCASVPIDLHWPRLKSALIYFAGPGVELLVLGLVVLLVGPDRMLSRSENLGLLACQGLGLAVLSSVFFNLVPHYALSQHGMVANDGLGIIQSFTRPFSDFEAMVGRTFDPHWREERDDPEEWEDDPYG